MNVPSGDDRASVLTPAGRGAVAVIATTGPAARAAIDLQFRAANGRPLDDQRPDRIVFGHWGRGDHVEEVILCRGDAQRLEIHCHGGSAAAARILDELVQAGCRVVSWREWLALESASPLDAEAEVALAAATTRRTAAILLDQRHGALRAAIDAVRAELTNDRLDLARRQLTALRHRAAVGLHLTTPWHVAIAGQPNVGKSSLLNAIVGYQRAIVFDQPGTTRDILAADAAIDGWPVRLTDSAGIRQAADSLEAEGVARAQHQLVEADLVVWVTDATRPGSHAVPGVSDFHPLIVVNKIDLAPFRPEQGDVGVSALAGLGLDQLLVAIAERLVPNPPAAGEAVPFTARQTGLIDVAIEQVDRGDRPAALETLTQLSPAAPI